MLIEKYVNAPYNKLMGANTKYKDSVFSFLFSDPNLLRELYGALEGVTLPPDVPIIINTLRDVLFLGMINDISFEIGGKLIVLIEHQSTINPNMALRLLMYIARVYEKIIGDRNVYSSRRVVIPRPEFYVLYNGVTPYPDRERLKLSDAFEKAGFFGLPEKGSAALELEVNVININEGKNEAIAKRCKTLAGYSVFVAKVRAFEGETGDRTEAMKRAVKYCRDHDILKEFLEKNATEVMNMLITEWNIEDAKKVWYEDGMEKGMEKGREEGREEGDARGREEVARNALAQGASLEFIQKITGLDIQTITDFQINSDN
jgi:hypothetical protein